MTGKTKAPEPTSKSRLRGCLRGCGVVLLVLIVLLLAGYLVEFYRCWQLEPTGDALFDKYATTVRNRQAWRLFHNSGPHPATLPDEVLAEWEPEFGDDPRYWQLRYWCVINSCMNQSELWMHGPTEEAETKARELLETARNRGVADADTLVLLLNILARDLLLESQENSSGEQKLREEIETILDEIQLSAPDWSWSYYTRALWYLCKDSDSSALTFINQGNAASDSHRPMCFPVGFVYERFNWTSCPGSKVVSGAVCDLDFYAEPLLMLHRYSSHFKCKKRILELIEAAATRGDMTALQQYHKFACRIGSGQGATLFDISFAIGLIRRQAYAVLRECPQELDADQRYMVLTILDRVSRLSSQLARYYAVIREERRVFDPLGPCWSRGTTRSWSYYPLTPLDDFQLRCLLWAYYRNHPSAWRVKANLAAHEVFQHRSATWDAFANMGQLDYRTLELPYDWWDIGARSGFPEIHPDAQPVFTIYGTKME